MRAGLPANWVPSNPESALDMYIAGVLAERLLLGHTLPGAVAGDLEQFKHGVLPVKMSADDRASMMPAATERVTKELSRSTTAIQAIAEALIEASRHGLGLSEADVRRAIGD